MNEYVKRAYDEISSFLLEDNKNMHIDSIIFDEKNYVFLKKSLQNEKNKV